MTWVFVPDDILCSVFACFLSNFNKGFLCAAESTKLIFSWNYLLHLQIQGPHFLCEDKIEFCLPPPLRSTQYPLDFTCHFTTRSLTLFKIIIQHQLLSLLSWISVWASHSVPSLLALFFQVTCEYVDHHRIAELYWWPPCSAKDWRNTPLLFNSLTVFHLNYTYIVSFKILGDRPYQNIFGNPNILHLFPVGFNRIRKQKLSNFHFQTKQKEFCSDHRSCFNATIQLFSSVPYPWQ